MRTQSSHPLSVPPAYRLPGALVTVLLAAALLALFVCSLISSTNAAGDVLTVNSTGDRPDANPGDGLCQTSTPGECTLRAAIMEANAGTGITHTIAFSLSGEGPFTIAPRSALPEVTHPAIVDGLTQPGASCDDWPPTLLIELDGTHVPASLFPPQPPIGLSLAAGNSVVRGLVVNRFTKAILGGDYGTGLAINRSGNNLIVCNFVGIEPDGDTPAPNQFGISLGNASGNIITRNLISGNVEEGIVISVDPQAGGESDGNRITANWIGTDRNGTRDRGNGGDGVLLVNARNTLVEGNLISGNADDGIDVTDTDATPVHSCTTPPCATGNRLVGNMIGAAAGGILSPALGNGDNGIEFKGAQDNLVADNLIVASGGHGVLINDLDTCTKGTTPCAVGNTIRANSIAANAGLGIDLAGGSQDSYGVTANDAGDADRGANELQNTPLLDEVWIVGSELAISGTLNSQAGSEFGLDFYVNATCDPSGYGEGQTWLTSHTVTTDDGGRGTFLVTTAIPLDRFITATATDANGSSSEFGGCVEVSGDTPPARTLTIAIAGRGSGSVKPAEGQHLYTMGTSVMLDATAASGSWFAGWSGDLVTTTNPVTVVLIQDMAITATFDLVYDVYLPLVLRLD
ncbi:MAG: right-handed parallel beta-helix repeat-containing protein [Anaerolineae bacterium]|nr:right-handed parallel beta-helix repeat-containing protein [Anaerolineae bacterium]